MDFVHIDLKNELMEQCVYRKLVSLRVCWLMYVKEN